MDMSTLVSAGQSFAAMKNIASALVDIRDYTKLAAMQADLLKQIVDAQGAMFEVQATLQAQLQEIGTLKAEIANLKKAAAERESYALYEICPGSFVYRSQLPVTPTTPMHYVCQPCFDKGVKGVLEVADLHMRGRTATCPVCERMISLRHGPPQPLHYDDRGVV
jgi:hypothetical protein